MLSITNGVRYYDIELHLYRLLIHQVAICSHLIIVVTVSKKLLDKLLEQGSHDIEPCDIYRASPHKFEIKILSKIKKLDNLIEAVKGRAKAQLLYARGESVPYIILFIAS